MNNPIFKAVFLSSVIGFALFSPAGGLIAQETFPNQQLNPTPPSVAKAILLSLAVPGLGHRYANHNAWTGKAKVYFAADLALILGYAGTTWREGAVIESYETLASTHAGGLVNQSRQYYVNLAQYQSSDLYADALLRNRQWQKLDALEDLNNQWNWDNENNWNRFQDQRLNAESLSRNATIMVTALITNRIFASIGAAIQANKAKNVTTTAEVASTTNRRKINVSATYLRMQPVNGRQFPVLQMNLKW